MLKLNKVDTIIQDHRMAYPTEMGRAYVTVVNVFLFNIPIHCNWVILLQLQKSLRNIAIPCLKLI